MHYLVLIFLQIGGPVSQANGAVNSNALVDGEVGMLLSQESALSQAVRDAAVAQVVTCS
jgi:hypothetical protein